MHIWHRKLYVLNKAEHWKCVLLWIDNYMYMSSFNNSFMLLYALSIFPLKTENRHQPIPGSNRKKRKIKIIMADDELKKKKKSGMGDGRERLNGHRYRKTEGHQAEDHNNSSSSLEFQGIRGCSLELLHLDLSQDEGNKDL